ncbi:MAG: ABC transporter permease [Gammaproteobacteria bacterium]
MLSNQQPFFQARRKSASPLRLFFTLHKQACGMSLHRMWAKPLQTLTTLVVLAVAFAMLTMLWLLWGNLPNWQPIWQRGFAMTLYLKPDISEAQKQNLVTQLRARPDVTQAQYISPAQGLEELQSRLKIDNLLASQEQNPLPSVVVIQPATVSAKAIRQLAQHLQRLSEVTTVQLNDKKVEQLAAVSALAGRIAYLLTGLLLVGLWFVIYSTIHIMLLPHPNELSLYKSLGASNTFVRRPFLYSGFWYGTLGALGGLLLAAVLKTILNPSLQQVAKAYDSSFVLRGLDLNFNIYLLLIGALLGWVSALLTLGKEWDALGQTSQ